MPTPKPLCRETVAATSANLPAPFAWSRDLPVGSWREETALDRCVACGGEPHEERPLYVWIVADCGYGSKAEGTDNDVGYMPVCDGCAPEMDAAGLELVPAESLQRS